MAKKTNPKAKAAEKGSATHGTADEPSLREQMDAALEARRARLEPHVDIRSGVRLRLRRTRHAMEGMRFDTDCTAYEHPLLVSHVALRQLISLLVDMILNGRNMKPLPNEAPGAPGVMPQQVLTISHVANYRTTGKNGETCLIADPNDPFSLPVTLTWPRAWMYELRGKAKHQLRVDLPRYLRTAIHFLNPSVIFDIAACSQIQTLGPFTGSSWHAVALNLSRAISRNMEEKLPRFLHFVEEICALDGFVTLPAHLESELSRVLDKHGIVFPQFPFLEVNLRRPGETVKSKPEQVLKSAPELKQELELEPSPVRVSSKAKSGTGDGAGLPILHPGLEYFIDRDGLRYGLDSYQQSFVRVLLGHRGRSLKSREITLQLRKLPHFKGKAQADKVWGIGRGDRPAHPAIGALVARKQAQGMGRDATWELLPHEMAGDAVTPPPA